MSGLKYMPLPKSQELKEALSCDGGLLMVEITDEVFLPGAKRWRDVVDMPENRRIMQLFMFALGVAVDVHEGVCLETIVSNEFETIHGGKLGRTIHVLGYRLWIPLKWVRSRRE